MQHRDVTKDNDTVVFKYKCKCGASFDNARHLAEHIGICNPRYVVLPTPKRANHHPKVHSAYMIGGMSQWWLP